MHQNGCNGRDSYLRFDSVTVDVDSEKTFINYNKKVYIRIWIVLYLEFYIDFVIEWGIPLLPLDLRILSFIKCLQNSSWLET